MYAKLIDGKLQYAPNPIRWNGEDIFTTNPIPYGYKPVIVPEPPETDSTHTAVFDGWEETETEIIQKWRIEETEFTAEDALDIIVGGEGV